ncbi:hypothetical protein ACH5RR_032489, partial [Cinchona calisaya]
RPDLYVSNIAQYTDDYYMNSGKDFVTWDSVNGARGSLRENLFCRLRMLESTFICRSGISVVIQETIAQGSRSQETIDQKEQIGGSFDSTSSGATFPEK